MYGWSSANSQCSNYISVIKNFIAYQGATCIKGSMVSEIWLKFSWNKDIPKDLIDDKSVLVSDNGLVPSGSKPLPQPMLTKIYDAIWYH